MSAEPAGKVTPAMVGKTVALAVACRDGRTRTFKGRLLSLGEGGGVLDTPGWPSSFKHGEVVAARVMS